MKKMILPATILAFGMAATPLQASEPATASNDAALMRLVNQNSAQLLKRLMWMHQQAEKAKKAQSSGEGNQYRYRHRNRHQAQQSGQALRKMLRSGRESGKAGLGKQLQKQIRDQKQARTRTRTRTRTRMHSGAGGGSGAGHGRR